MEDLNQFNSGGDCEIGIALSQYHHKLGPRFVEIFGPLSNSFDSVTQYNVLQDSITIRSTDLALYVRDKYENPYICRIRKIKIQDSVARGGIQRYAIILLLPQDLEVFGIEIDEISGDIIEKLTNGANVSSSLEAWYTILNDQFGKLETETDIKLIGRMKQHFHTYNLF